MVPPDATLHTHACTHRLTHMHKLSLVECPCVPGTSTTHVLNNVHVCKCLTTCTAVYLGTCEQVATHRFHYCVPSQVTSIFMQFQDIYCCTVRIVTSC